jgi:hypothetical protein
MKGVRNYILVDPPSDSQQAKYWSFPGCTGATLTILFASKVAFTTLKIATKHALAFFL